MILEGARGGQNHSVVALLSFESRMASPTRHSRAVHRVMI